MIGSGKPPVIAFHSFKGGVGRTLNALAMAKSLTDYNKDIKVLFIDADLEAPGVTWLIQKRFPKPSVSFADLLALVHGDSDPDAKESIKLVADRTRNMLVDRIFLLPSFRTSAQFANLEIRPEHIVQGAKNPFILTEAVSSLGFELGVDAVVIDLRAGLSEISAGYLLDPRVFRVIVTTLSSQSIEGTLTELELLGKLAPSSNENEPLPAIIYSQVPEDFIKSGMLSTQEERVLEASRLFLNIKSEIDTTEEENYDDDSSALEIVRIVTQFNSTLQVLPEEWNDIIKRIIQARLNDELKPLIEWVPISTGLKNGSHLSLIDVSDSRSNLSDFTKRLIFAETGTLTEFLSIPPLRNLASDFSHKIPISVVIGAKGSGKTYTYLQLVLRTDWAKFIGDVGIENSSLPALICPVMKSKNILSETNINVLSVRSEVAEKLNIEPPPSLSDISDYIKDALKNDLHEGDWRELWIDILAWSTGFQKFKKGAGRSFSKFLKNKNERIVLVIDGLEDLFQDLSKNEKQQIAIRSLIQDTPEWLEQQPDKSIGLLIFVRQDMVLTSVKQNSSQLLARYEPYSLRWNMEEALRLAAWINLQSRSLPKLIDQNIDLIRLNREQITDVLIDLWGRKLGSESSREARSAEWVIAALSDLKGQIQARDLVRFLNEAAKRSCSDTYWKDRILIPKAIKAALPVCSKEKIDEISIENSQLKEIFTNLRSISNDKQLIPFTREQVGLSIEQMQILENNGVAYSEKEEYYMPEIYRAGLQFRLKAGARPRVLALSRKTQK